MKPILDPCCGSRMFWFDKKDERAVFTDKRSEQHTLCDGRELIIEPDMVMDFTDLQFDDEQFHMVVFDPPHLRKGMDDELPDWRKQLKAIGNGQDPIVMATAYNLLSGA